MVQRIARLIALLLVGVGVALVATKCRVNDNDYLMNVNKEGVILDGYDTVAFFTQRKPVKGKPEIQVKYNDAIFYFASEGNKKIFQGNPKKYMPQFGGWCAYAVSEGHVSPINVKFFKIQGGRLILQHNEKAWGFFEKNPDGNMQKANKNWPELLAEHKDGSYVGF